MVLTPSQLDAETLAGVLEQSSECVKLLDPSGALVWMNGTGLAAMEIQAFSAVQGAAWTSLWPEAARPIVLNALDQASHGATQRFEAERPNLAGRPRWWEIAVSPVRGIDGELSGYLCTSRDTTAQRRDREALGVLMREMRHRLRNTYAILSGLMRGFAQGDPVRELFADEMADRLAALAAAQSLFADDAAPSALPQLLNALILPFDGPGCPIALQTPPALTLDRAQADAIALVVGELSVNSGKHGALRHGGRIGVATAVEDGLLRMRWDERSARPVRDTDRKGGQGLELIRTIVAARDGGFDIVWHPDGLTATLGLVLGEARG